MTNCFKTVVSILSLLFIRAAFACAAPGTPAFVSHVGFVFNNGTVLFHKGEDDRMRPGDIFEVVRNGERIATLEAVSVDSFYTRARILRSQAELVESDIVREIEDATKGGPFDMNKEEVGLITQGGSPYLKTPGMKTPQDQAGDAKAPSGGAAAGGEYTGAKGEAIEKKESPSPFSVGGMPGQAPAETAADAAARELPSSGPMVSMDPELQEKMQKKKLAVDLSGYRYLKFRSYSSSGNDTSFQSRNGLLTYGNKYEQGTQLDISAAYGGTEIKGTFYELPLQERDMVFDFKTVEDNYKVLFGDFSSEFRSGSLATVDKKVTGAHAQYTTEKMKVDYLVSRSKSESRSASFYGDNTHGPFTLKAFQVLEDSEKVRLNGKAVPPEDYYIDYYLGQITFCKQADITDCVEIKSSDLVQVEFEEKLLLSLKGGNLSAMSASYMVNDNISIGAAKVQQEANRFSRRVRDSSTLTIAGDEIAVQFDCPAVSTICLPKTYKGVYTLMVKNFQRVFKNDKVYDGYELDAEGYARGEILLTEPYAASDTFRVEYTYYVEEYAEDVALESGDGEIFPEAPGQLQYQLGQGRIYEGTEFVRLCQGSLDDCTNFTVLERDIDYTINEEINSIEFRSAALAPDQDSQQFAQISYVYVQEGSSQSSDYDHTVEQVFGSAVVGPVSLTFEAGRSVSDISKNPVQILRERVAVAAASMDCPSPADSVPACSFFLNHTSVVQLSESITVNTTDVPLQRGFDYNINYESGRLMLMGDYHLDKDAVIMADYQYNPPIPEGLLQGNATLLSASTEFKGYTVNLGLNKADTYFAPISGNNTLETSRRDISVSGSPVEGLDLSIGRSSYDVAQDVFESSVATTEQENVSLGYVSKGGYSLKYEFGTEDTVDNLPIHNRKETKDYTNVGIGAKGVFLKTLGLDFSRSEEQFTDQTGQVDNQAASTNELGIDYKASEKLDLSMNLKNTEVETSGVTAPFSTLNESRTLKADYYPNDLITVTADIDRQNRTDTRPDSEGSAKDSSTIAISASPFGNFRAASITIVNQSLASFTSGTTNTKTSTITFQYAITAALTFRPSLTTSSSRSPSNSSNSNRKSMGLDYRPVEKKYSSTMMFETTDTQSSSQGNASSSASSSTMNRILWDVKYELNEKSAVIYKYDNSSNKYSSGTSTSTSHSMNAIHAPSEKKEFSLKYVTTSRGGTSSSTENSLRLGSNVQLTEVLSWNTELKSSKYNTDSANQGYSGTILETELRAEFK